jgi:hypothetical protein
MAEGEGGNAERQRGSIPTYSYPYIGGLKEKGDVWSAKRETGFDGVVKGATRHAEVRQVRVYGPENFG